MLYAATSEGVFRLATSDDHDGRCARFERVHAAPAYALVSHPGGLLVLGYAEVIVQTATGFTAVANVPAGGGTMFRSKHDPSRVWIHGAQEIHSLQYSAQHWHHEGLADNRDETTREAPEATGGARTRLPMLVKEAAGPIARMREENDRAGAVLWICGARGLVRLDVARGFPTPVPFATLLNATGVREGERLTPEHTAVKFDYVALRHQIANSVGYQTRLIGFDDDWSSWSPKRERIFTSLPAGDYRFEVRARDADGRLSAPASLAFTVLPPWWRTWWALLAYAAAGGGLIAGVVRLRTRALHGRAERLEVVVAQRTYELAQKTIELTRLHQLDLDENIAAHLAEEKARLEVLRYQLNPHFLYNTLASISSSLPAGPSVARSMVERLAEFCRLTLHRPNEGEWTTLGAEMHVLRVYLEIEQSRWGDLLDVAIVGDPAIDHERLPHFLLLPLVENALKHGRATSPERVGLRLASHREPDGTLVITVANTGEWIEPTTQPTVSSLGIGLENLRERLARYYPRAHQLTFSHADGWVTATLRLSAQRHEAGDGVAAAR